MKRGAALLVVVALAVLFGWQWHRERLMRACLNEGGDWNGRQSRCDPPPGRPILQRDYQRS